MEPKTIVIRSSRCRKELIFDNLCLELNLPASYRFSEKTCVRLHSAAGLSEEVHVCISFAERVPFGDTFRRHLAIAAPGTLPGPWSRVDGNFINNISALTLSKIDGDPFTQIPSKDFALVLEFTREDGGPRGYPGL